jgi:hypothetical protein
MSGVATPEQDAAADAYALTGSLDAKSAIVLWDALAERSEDGTFKQLCIDSVKLLRDFVFIPDDVRNRLKLKP